MRERWIVAVCLGTLLGSACGAPEPSERGSAESASEAMSLGAGGAEANALVDRYYAAFNGRDRAAYEQLFSEEVELWAPGATVSGAQAMMEWDMKWADAFPDGRITSIRKIADGAFVVSENRFSGTHMATLQTPDGEIPPTGKHIDVPYVGVFEVEGGKLKAQRIYYDRLELLSQLGLEP